MKFIVFTALLFTASTSLAQTTLPYVPAPPDNPLKGLVPYARPTPNRFPHSMEFDYLPLSDLMKGPETFDWQPMENLLNDIGSRRHQTVFRIWMEYPGHRDGIPKFLEDAGVKVTEWLNTNTAPFPPTKVRTPDYEDPRLRAALETFIAELGRKYDGDPRIGYITAGLLGTWGEWHTYPKDELMASKQVQVEVMDAFEKAFRKTPVLLRYPAGDSAWAHAPNHRRRLGYHDDSFAWATLDTGRSEDSWFFVPALKAAGPLALSKWKTSPIGGEIRPELWGQIFDEQPEHAMAQDFAECVRQTHVTWLMDTGMFQKKQSKSRIENAIKQVQKMGYEFHIASWETKTSDTGEVTITVQVRNTGVAPFYHDWKVELVAIDRQELLHAIPVDWTVSGLLPDDDPRIWTVQIAKDHLPPSATRFALRVANPMRNGIPLRFANKYGDRQREGWLELP